MKCVRRQYSLCWFLTRNKTALRQQSELGAATENDTPTTGGRVQIYSRELTPEMALPKRPNLNEFIPDEARVVDVTIVFLTAVTAQTLPTP